MKLLNSAMMPQPGNYEMKKIHFEEFVSMAQAAFAKNNLISYIGYPQNIDLMIKWTMIKLPLNRDITVLNDEDEMLIMKLNYRVNSGNKGKSVSENDFEFFHCRYTK